MDLESNVNVESIQGESFEDKFLYDTILFKDVKEAQQTVMLNTTDVVQVRKEKELVNQMNQEEVKELGEKNIWI